ncbi:hypothetical protein AB0D42_27325 [Streptomyces sp. NPDC048304]|uniref:hypothetical protein n=1 Tax=Streptomyces sp. NPDC048304 TaxID=3154820 RepID=UPI0033C46FCC
MYKYVINKDLSSQREVEATGFATVGDCIDFYGIGDSGDKIVTLRIRAARVDTVERITS